MADTPPPLEKIGVLYFNGFVISFGNADFSIRLRLDNIDQVELKGSYTCVKTLAEKLTGLVTLFEETTQHKVMTSEEVRSKLEVLRKQGAETNEVQPE